MAKDNGTEPPAPHEEQEDLVTINIGNINNGAAVDQFEIALEDVPVVA